MNRADSALVKGYQGSFSDERVLRRIWMFSIAVSVRTVESIFTYVNISKSHGGIPFGYDSYYYVGWINQVAYGSLQFAAVQNYVEFFHTIVASIPVYRGPR